MPARSTCSATKRPASSTPTSAAPIPTGMSPSPSAWTICSTRIRRPLRAICVPATVCPPAPTISPAASSILRARSSSEAHRSKNPRPAARAGVSSFQGASLRSTLHHVPQHILQDAAMPVVLDLVEGIDPAGHGHVLLRPIRPRDGHGNIHARLDAGSDAGNVEDLRAVELQGLAGHAVLELQRQEAHTDQVRAVDALEAL